MLSEILDYLKRNRESSASEIAVILKLDRQMTENALAELVNKGRVERSLFKYASCGNCGGCSASSCADKEVYRYINNIGSGKRLAS